MEARAERLVAAGLKRFGWKETTLATLPKGDPRKVILARQLRAATTMPLGWIAHRLAMGTRGYLSWLLNRAGKKNRI
jgi:hypothetical protein